MNATSEIAMRAEPPRPDTLAVKLFDCREPSYTKMRPVGTPASCAMTTSASRTGPSGTGLYWLNSGSISAGAASRNTASDAAVSPPDHAHQRGPARRIRA